MAEHLPEGIQRSHLLLAIADLDKGVAHDFGRSVFYDVLFKGRRYPPKAVAGLAAAKLTGRPYGPYHFKGGEHTICFRILRENGFEIVAKTDFIPFPEEVHKSDVHTEGAVLQVTVNRYERDEKARKKCIAHHGCRCQVCRFDFEAIFGPIGSGYIHVHHLVLISSVGQEYVVDPVNDLAPVCPNCHAMIHRRSPPYSIVELRELLLSRADHLHTAGNG